MSSITSSRQSQKKRRRDKESKDHGKSKHPHLSDLEKVLHEGLSNFHKALDGVSSIPSSRVSPFSSSMFTVFAGRDERAVYAHADILSRSDMLTSLVGGNWKENKDPLIKLPQFEYETVARSVRWLYTGDYDGPYLVDDTLSALPEEGAVATKDPPTALPNPPEVASTGSASIEILRKLVPEAHLQENQAL